MPDPKVDLQIHVTMSLSVLARLMREVTETRTTDPEMSAAMTAIDFTRGLADPDNPERVAEPEPSAQPPPVPEPEPMEAGAPEAGTAPEPTPEPEPEPAVVAVTPEAPKRPARSHHKQKAAAPEPDPPEAATNGASNISPEPVMRALLTEYSNHHPDRVGGTVALLEQYGGHKRLLECPPVTWPTIEHFARKFIAEATTGA